MTQGYVSDAEGDDRVMNTPTVTVTIDPSGMPPEQVLALIQEADPYAQKEWVLGALERGDAEAISDVAPIEFHFPLDVALTALASVGAVDLPQDPSDVEVEEQNA